MDVRTQPIAIDELVAYALAARDLPPGAEGVYEIGGPDTPLGESRSEIRQTAIFDPAGLAGLFYWYVLYPVHALILGGLLRAIAARAEAEPPPPQSDPIPVAGRLETRGR